MAPKPNIISTLTKGRGPTTKTLQALLLRMGSATSGRKDELFARLERDRHRSKIPGFHTAKKSIRILSIDMGIKNLAFCVADVLPPTSKTRASNMDIKAWRRLDVVAEVTKTAALEKSKAGKNSSDIVEELEDPYMPSSLSKTAYTLLRKTLLPYNPDIVLIERQRWRSSGGSAIQQWTVRVNTLEGMLWAILTALRAESTVHGTKNGSAGLSYEIFGVDPKRVGNFWIGEDVRAANPKRTKKKRAEELELGLDGEVEDIVRSGAMASAVEKLGRGKAEKKAKIQLLRTWLGSEAPSTTPSTLDKRSQSDEGPSTPTISFSFSPEAETTRQALLQSTSRATKRSAKANSERSSLKKVDDITDCFLQAAAWVAWEENRIDIFKMGG